MGGNLTNINGWMWQCRYRGYSSGYAYGGRSRYAYGGRSRRFPEGHVWFMWVGKANYTAIIW